MIGSIYIAANWVAPFMFGIWNWALGWPFGWPEFIVAAILSVVIGVVMAEA